MYEAGSWRKFYFPFKISQNEKPQSSQKNPETIFLNARTEVKNCT